MKNKLSFKIAAFCLVSFVLLFIFLQSTSVYHFFFIEQNQLFLFSWPYIADHINQPGGLALLVGEFLVQFFVLPYAGAFITAFLLTVMIYITALICKKIAPFTPFYFLYALPAVCLLFMHFNFNYLLQGTVAYIFLLLLLFIYLRIDEFKWRLVYAFVAIPLLYFGGGSIVSLFAVCVLLWEILNRTPRGYWITLILVETIIITLGSLWMAFVGEYRFAFLPDLYFHHGLAAPIEIYFSWVALLFVLIVACAFRKWDKVNAKKEIAASVVQLLMIAGVCWVGIPKYNDEKSIRLKELDYYARNGQWDQIIENSKGNLTNYLYLNHLNRALAEKGVLADRMFSFDQRGIQGLFITWNKTANLSTLLSDFHYTIGNIAISQEMAFECYVSSLGYGNPRMLKRLVETNLIYGAWPVAEKYLDILSKTLFYKNWAKEYRRFVYNDEAVINDPILGAKRKGLLDKNFLSNPATIALDLVSLANHNPENRLPLECVGAAYLLAKDISGFEGLLNEYYGTEILPELPVSFQEAVIILNENNPERWSKYNINPGIIERFGNFKRLILSNAKNPPYNELRRLHGDTYWFYFMFK